MIVTTLDNIKQFKGLYPNLDTAITYILENDIEQLPLGRTTIDGDNVFVNHFTYNTAPKEEGFLEGHEQYLDLHFTISGNEYIGYVDTADTILLQPYDKNDDFYKYSGDVKTLVYMENGNIVITDVEDAHQPKIMVTKPQEVDKLVFKIKVK